MNKFCGYRELKKMQLFERRGAVSDAEKELVYILRTIRSWEMNFLFYPDHLSLSLSLPPSYFATLYRNKSLRFSSSSYSSSSSLPATSTFLPVVLFPISFIFSFLLFLCCFWEIITVITYQVHADSHYSYTMSFSILNRHFVTWLMGLIKEDLNVLCNVILLIFF